MYVLFLQFLSSLHTYNKHFLFPQYLAVHANVSYLRSKKLSTSGGTLPPDTLTRGSAPKPPSSASPILAIPPNPGRLDKTLAVKQSLGIWPVEQGSQFRVIFRTHAMMAAIPLSAFQVIHLVVAFSP